MSRLTERPACSGQSLLEFSICLWVVVAAVLATAGLLSSEWRRARCAHRAFELTRRHLAGEVGSWRYAIHFQRRQGSIEGRLRCGSISETVVLPELETARLDTGP